MSVQATCREIDRGALTRDTDEAGAGGFWDIAGELSDIRQDNGRPALTEIEQETLQVNIYEALWAVYEAK